MNIKYCPILEKECPNKKMIKNLLEEQARQKRGKILEVLKNHNIDDYRSLQRSILNEIEKW